MRRNFYLSGPPNNLNDVTAGKISAGVLLIAGLVAAYWVFKKKKTSKSIGLADISPAKELSDKELASVSSLPAAARRRKARRARARGRKRKSRRAK